MELNKLVRDNAVDKMLDEGLTVKCKKLKGDELIDALIIKLLEEINELERSLDLCASDNIIEVAADILTILDVIRGKFKISLQDIIYEAKVLKLKEIYKLRPYYMQ